jgi:PAS domain S-box-containing protein
MHVDVFERRVLDAIPNTIYTLDLDGCITSVNRAWSRFAESNGAPGIASEENVCGQTIWSAISDPSAREQIERALVLLRSGRADVLSWEFPCDSPTEQRIFLLQIAPIRDERAVIGFVCTTIDITRGHRSREVLIGIGTALSRAIDRDRVCQEVALQIRRAIPNDGVVIALLDESGELRVAHRSGYDMDTTAALDERLAAAWREAASSGQLLLHHGVVGVELTAGMRGAEGPLGAFTVLADAIDSPQQLDEAQRVLSTIAAQTAVALERATHVRRVQEKRQLEAIGEVAAGVAHELRNPLFGISSAAQLLRFRAAEDPVIERNVGRILREVERLNGMVTELLEFGRPRPLQLRSGDPDEVWDEVLEANRGLLESRELLLERTRVATPAACDVDRERLAQVFLNVLMNAVDDAPVGTDLALSSTMLSSGAWRCTLRSQGSPIPPDVLPRVFEIFFSTKPGGTGIGLALCHRIVDEHNGTIGIESEPARGTTVTITLPSRP